MNNEDKRKLAVRFSGQAFISENEFKFIGTPSVFKENLDSVQFMKRPNDAIYFAKENGYFDYLME